MIMILNIKILFTFALVNWILDGLFDFKSTAVKANKIIKELHSSDKHLISWQKYTLLWCPHLIQGSWE